MLKPDPEWESFWVYLAAGSIIVGTVMVTAVSIIILVKQVCS